MKTFIGGRIADMDPQKEGSQAIGWTDGTTLYGKKRWHVCMYPYTEPANHVILFQNSPPKYARIVNGPVVAYRAAKMVTRSPNKALFTNSDKIEGLNQLRGTGKTGISPHGLKVTVRHTVISGHKDIPTQPKDTIDGNGPVFPLK
jgi:hypothetical protein